MDFQYSETTKRLNVYGTDGVKDIQEVKKLIRQEKIPAEISSLYYQRSRHSGVGMLFRGQYLDNLLRPDREEDDQAKNTPTIRNILKKINQANTSQSIYAGLLIYATNTKRFLFMLPKKRTPLYGLIGDNPRDGETPTDTVVRVANEDCHFLLNADCLVNLTKIEIDGTTYHCHLVLSNHEFKSPLSENFTGATWRSYEAMEELSLHPSVVQLFEKDKKLQRLITPIEVDFDKLIDEILHSN